MRSDAGRAMIHYDSNGASPQDQMRRRGAASVSHRCRPKLPDIGALKHLDGSAHPMLTSTKRFDVGMA